MCAARKGHTHTVKALRKAEADRDDQVVMVSVGVLQWALLLPQFPLVRVFDL